MKKVTAALLTKENKIMIARRKLEGKLGGLWEFPGGKLEEYETPEEALKREIQEEFKIDIKVNEFYSDSIYTYDDGTIHLLAYWAEWLDGEMVLLDHDKVKWVKAKEMRRYAFAPADVPIVKKLVSEFEDIK